MEELVVRQGSETGNDWHKVEFKHGILCCSCGWRSEKKFRTIASVHKAAKAHIKSVKGDWKSY